MENQRVLAAKQFIKNQTKKASDYFKPTEKVRARDVIRELPGAVAQTFSGTRDTVVKGGKILGEGLAYATSPNVRKMYQAGNTDILPTVSNTTPRQMLANTAKSAFEIAPVGKIKGLATAAMSAKLLPRVLAGGAMGYGYDVADKMSRPEPVSQSTFHPGIATLAGALFGGMSRPTSEMLGQSGEEIANDVRTINPANRVTHKVVDKYDTEPVPGVFAPGGIQQQRPIMESFRKEVETTQNPYNPQSSLVKFFLGKQPMGMSTQAVDNPLLQEARNGEYLYHGTGGTSAESILKEGLKPGRRGQLSLSKDEAYAKGYAQDGMTPQGKTEGTMFRVKADFLKGKTTLKRADGKPRPASDELNELLTKENIPPEALEVYKNGKWQPLKENPLLSEAKKYKSAEEFEKSLNLMKWGKVTGVGELPIDKLSKSQMKVLLKDGLPENGGSLKVSDFKPGRKITQPIEVSQRGSTFVVENGRHRLFQAIANGDKTIPVAFKSGEGKAYSTPLTDLYNKAQGVKSNKK